MSIEPALDRIGPRDAEAVRRAAETAGYVVFVMPQGIVDLRAGREQPRRAALCGRRVSRRVMVGQCAMQASPRRAA
jgi:hypothetical protein